MCFQGFFRLNWIDAALTDTHWANQPAHEVWFVENVVRITESDIVHERTEGRNSEFEMATFMCSGAFFIAKWSI